MPKFNDSILKSEDRKIDRMFGITAGFIALWTIVSLGFVGVIVWAIIKIVRHFMG